MNVKHYRNLFIQKRFDNIIQDLSYEKKLNSGLLYQIFIDSCLQMGKLDLAKEKWEQLNKQFPKFPNNLLLKAKIYKKQGLWNSALKHFTLSLQNYSYTNNSLTKVRIDMLDCFLNLNNKKQIENVLSQILATEQNSKVLFRVFKKIIDSNCLKLAENYTSKLEPNSIEYHHVNAILFEKKLNWRKAATHWEQTCALIPNDVRLKMNLLRAYEKAGLTNLLRKLSADILSAENIKPKNIRILFLTLLKTEQYEIIENSLQHHKKELDKEITILLESSLAYQKQSYAEVILKLVGLREEYKKLPPQLSKISFKLLIDAYLECEKANEFLDTCFKCTDEFPKYNYAYHKLIIWYQKNQSFNNLKGIEVLEEAIAKGHIETPGMILRFCNILELLGQEQKSYKILNKVVGDNELYILPLLKKYMALENLGGITNFLDFYEKKIQDPSVKLKAFKFLFETYFKNGHYNYALQILDKIVGFPVDNESLNIELHLFAIEVLRLKNTLEFDSLDLARILNVEERSKAIKHVDKLKVIEKLNKHLDLLCAEFADHPIKSILCYNYDKTRGKKLLNTYSTPREILDLVEFIKEKIKNKTPCSFIRLGDGEGTFLPYPKEMKPFQKEDQQRILNIWWPKSYSTQNDFLDSIQEAFYKSITEADILGVSPKRRHLKVIKNVKDKDFLQLNGSVRGLLSLVYNLQSVPFNADIITSSYAQADLDSWGAYQHLFEDLDEVAIISCHKNIVDYLKRRFGFRNVELLKIPGENKYVKQFNYVIERDHYPVVYNEICSKLKLESKGKVFLVAAGFLGKIYCNIIKQNGGIAIDIGSIVDKWLGYNTRSYHGAPSIINGIQFQPYSSTSLPIAEKSQVIRTNLYHNKILSPIEPVADKINVKILLTGHPRSGTGYASSLFNNMGIDVGHEKIDSYGISSWIHAVKNQNAPFFVEKKIGQYNISRYDFDYEYLLLLIRDPSDIIPSIVIENKNNISYNYRRFHIYQELGIDLNNYSYWLDKAIVSYLSWIKIIEKQNPYKVLRLESLNVDLIQFFKQNGITYKSIDHNKLSTSNSNSTKQKYGIEKPTITKNHYKKADPLVLHQLNMFCEQYGYTNSFILK